LKSEISEQFNKIADLNQTKPHASGTDIFGYMAPLLGK